jgi:predicted naringenin-chalcone synthase
MGMITTIATAVPPYPMTCAAVKQAVQQVFQLEPHMHTAVMAVFDHAQVARRNSVVPLDKLIRERSLTQTNEELHIEHQKTRPSWEVLRQCIAIEEAVLLANPTYRAVMGPKPRFVPGIMRR